MDTERILQSARLSIGKYCMEECNAYCCRKGYLVLTLEEKNAVVGEDPDAPVKPIGEKFSLYIGKYDRPCRRLKDNKCTIFDHPNRPQICKDFPILRRDNVIFLSRRCPAVKEGKFYQYASELKRAGFKIVEGDEITDTEYWKILPSQEG